jgi:hypothetical protein
MWRARSKSSAVVKFAKSVIESCGAEGFRILTNGTVRVTVVHDRGGQAPPKDGFKRAARGRTDIESEAEMSY